MDSIESVNGITDATKETVAGTTQKAAHPASFVTMVNNKWFAIGLVAYGTLSILALVHGVIFSWSDSVLGFEGSFPGRGLDSFLVFVVVLPTVLLAFFLVLVVVIPSIFTPFLFGFLVMLGLIGSNALFTKNLLSLSPNFSGTSRRARLALGLPDALGFISPTELLDRFFLITGITGLFIHNRDCTSLSLNSQIGGK